MKPKFPSVTIGLDLGDKKHASEGSAEVPMPITAAATCSTTAMRVANPFI
ncbi:MAG: hypothetical protein NTV46_04370 [Verrucomicrobia bacterium]|nr:hypothetical protein [Verrucomicrobiota bacterium]